MSIYMSVVEIFGVNSNMSIMLSFLVLEMFYAALLPSVTTQEGRESNWKRAGGTFCIDTPPPPQPKKDGWVERWVGEHFFLLWFLVSGAFFSFNFLEWYLFCCLSLFLSKVEEVLPPPPSPLLDADEVRLLEHGRGGGGGRGRGPRRRRRQHRGQEGRDRRRRGRGRGGRGRGQLGGGGGGGGGGDGGVGGAGGGGEAVAELRRGRGDRGGVDRRDGLVLEAGRLVVLVQVGLEGERLVAALALEVLESGVRLHVGPEVGAVGEALAAVGTAVGLVARV